ncbi:MAG: hypothetical protein COB67_09110 [SAR324 cluster bacterium]|uniref:Thioredoxin domain-containing protein n=1 Tax=SAR324 cluster bacterium TaxID=2024889 RepID=A0A2A4T127_9DELT|nr:MAG: hypothetical protein COB67_09110 [SAR324 cluster bacterium]
MDSVLPPPSGQYLISDDFISEEEAKVVKWLDSLEEAKLLAQATQKPIFLDFTGYTCVNCRWMEQNIFALKDIHKTMAEDFILVRLYTDGGQRAEENLQLQIERFNTVALPFYVLLSKDDQFLKSFSGISRNPEEFADFLAL